VIAVSAQSARGVTPEIGTAVLSSQHDDDPTTDRLVTNENAGYMVAGG
jgi:hypothetical protein